MKGTLWYIIKIDNGEKQKHILTCIATEKFCNDLLEINISGYPWRWRIWIQLKG